MRKTHERVGPDGDALALLTVAGTLERSYSLVPLDASGFTVLPADSWSLPASQRRTPPSSD